MMSKVIRNGETLYQLQWVPFEGAIPIDIFTWSKHRPTAEDARDLYMKRWPKGYDIDYDEVLEFAEEARVLAVEVE